MLMPKSNKYIALLALSLVACLRSYATPLAASITSAPDYSKNFDISQFPTHRIATIRNVQRGSKATHQYALVPKGAALPELPAGITVIRTPVTRVVVMETVYIGYLDALNQLDTIIAAATPDYISNATIRTRIEDGTIQKVQSGAALNIERMLMRQPDLILSSSTGDPAFDVPLKLARAGLPVVLSAGYMEQHPLARAEWIKFIAAFFNAEHLAEQIFEASATRYELLLKKVEQIEQRPTVFCGAPYSGAWHMAGGESYLAQASVMPAAIISGPTCQVVAPFLSIPNASLSEPLMPIHGLTPAFTRASTSSLEPINAFKNFTLGKPATYLTIQSSARPAAAIRFGSVASCIPKTYSPT